jgi:glycolate oxidase FAD binding subunit
MSTEMKKNSQIYQDSNNTYYPEEESQVSDIVKELYKKSQPTELIGTGTKNFIGNKIQSAHKISFSKLSGIVEYLPHELYIKVKANTSLELVEKELEKK